MKFKRKEIEHDELQENREAAMFLAREAAIHGCPIAGALFELESYASKTGYGRFTATTMQDFREEDEDDEMRDF